MRRRIANALRRRARQGARDERGAVAIIFALSIVVLVPLVLGLFDLYTASEQKARLQDAVDAAALYAARSDFTNDADINTLAGKAFTANLKLIRGATLVSSNFHLTDNGTKVVGSATIKPLAIAPALWTHLAVTVGTEVVRNSRNLEVSLVLDGTGSMSGTKIADLKVAAKELVDLVVKEQQAPYYSKVALVPWAAGVNVGNLANSVRGATTPARNITAATWRVGAEMTISAATQAKPVVITTSANHGFSNGDKVFISGVSGMTDLNNNVFTVANKTNTTFELSGVDGRSYSKFKSSSGTPRVSKCERTNCTLKVTSNGHGFTNGQFIVMTDMAGISTAMSASGGSSHNINNWVYTVANVTTNTFDLTEAVGPVGDYTANSGKAWCTSYGCEFFRFRNQDNNADKTYRVSTCVSERSGAEMYTDAAPTTSLLRYHYPAVAGVGGTSVSYNSPCPEQSIKPLTSTKKTITDAIDAMKAEGTTAGQVGVAWAWYMLSPNFNSLWSGNASAAYDKPDTLKVAVIMTDGALNTAYCNGVSSSDSLMFSADRIRNCNAPNGTTFTQSLALCQAMRDKGIVIYTVGFDISGDATATSFVERCATDAAHVYKPESGAQLKEAFKAIGAELNNLRLAR